MCSAESAIFLSFHSIWMSFLFFCHVVVTLFAFCTCQCDFYTHNSHLQWLIYFSVLGTKKRPISSRPFTISYSICLVKCFSHHFLHFFVTVQPCTDYWNRCEGACSQSNVFHNLYMAFCHKRVSSYEVAEKKQSFGYELG